MERSPQSHPFPEHPNSFLTTPNLFPTHLSPFLIHSRQFQPSQPFPTHSSPYPYLYNSLPNHPNLVPTHASPFATYKSPLPTNECPFPTHHTRSDSSKRFPSHRRLAYPSEPLLSQSQSLPNPLKPGLNPSQSLPYQSTTIPSYPCSNQPIQTHSQPPSQPVPNRSKPVPYLSNYLSTYQSISQARQAHSQSIQILHFMQNCKPLGRVEGKVKRYVLVKRRTNFYFSSFDLKDVILRGTNYKKGAAWLRGCGVAQRVRRGSAGCGVAQIVARRLAVRQARVRIPARHPRGGPLPSGTLRVV
jgi:hypothetical protein